MKRRKRIVGCLMVLMLLFAVVSAQAAMTKQDGLLVTLTAKEQVGEAGEQIAVTLSVKNTNAHAVKGLSLEQLLPAGYKLVSGALTGNAASLAAGKTQTLTAIYQRITEADVVLPVTGDRSSITLWLFALLGAAGGLSLLMVKQKKRLLSLMLAGVLTGASLCAPVSGQAQGDLRQIEVKETVKLFGAWMNFEAWVRYAGPESAENPEILGMIRVTTDYADLYDGMGGNVVGTASRSDVFYFLSQSPEGEWYRTLSGAWIKAADVIEMTDEEMDEYLGNNSNDGIFEEAAKESESYGRVTKDNVYLRSSTTMEDSSRLLLLNKGKDLRITRIRTVNDVKWYYITVKSGGMTYKGYLRSDMVTLISRSEFNANDSVDLGSGEILGMIRVTANNAALRLEPDSSADKVNTANKGDAFYYTERGGKDNKWFRTQVGYWIKNDVAVVMTAAEVDDYINSDVYDGGTYKEGDVDPMVAWIQMALMELNIYDGEITGHYGGMTKNAVSEFQRRYPNELSEDGVASPKTIQKLIDEVSKSYASSSTTGTYNSKIYNVDWFTYKSKIIASGTKTPTITDISTGRTFSVYIQSSSNHADVEPKTAKDTEVLCSLYSVANADQLVTMNKYQRRAVVFTNAAGEQFIGSIYAIPHGVNTISNNNFDGQFCLHFLNSKTHGTDRVDTDVNGHQEKIKAGVNALKTVRDDDGNAAITIKTVYP